MITKQKAKKAVRQIYPKAQIKGIYRFKHGLVNKTVHLKILNPKKDLILRIYLDEAWKAEKERFLFNLIKIKTDIPVAKVLFVDKSKKIFPKAYSMLNMIEGHSLDDEYNKYGFNKNLAKKSGEILAKLHSIKFPYYGWIIGTNIEPKFSSWIDFVKYMVNINLKDLKKIDEKLTKKIESYTSFNIQKLITKSRPCLVHKDYHFPHIIVNNHKINGIIDFEWAISGHKEFDFVKPKMWMFNKFPEMEKPFFEGYKSFGNLSNKYNQRVEVYEAISLISLALFSYKKNRKLMAAYLKKINELIK